MPYTVIDTRGEAVEVETEARRDALLSRGYTSPKPASTPKPPKRAPAK